MYLVYEFALGEDPALLSQTLWRLKIPHRIVSDDSQKNHGLWVINPNHQQPAKQLVDIWHSDPASLSHVEMDANSPLATSEGFVDQMKRSPATVLVLLAAILVALITQLGSDLSTIKYFTISPIYVVGNNVHFFKLSDVLANNEYWRLVTPALIHFSVMHIVFNGLWVWDIGRRLERMVGTITWVVGVILIAIFSNVVQYQIIMNPMFGGLSGVVYGLIGFAWLMPILRKDWPVIVSKNLMIFFMVWLGLGYAQIFESFGLGSIANTAHSIGLCAGLVLGVVYWGVTKHRPLKTY